MYMIYINIVKLSLFKSSIAFFWKSFQEKRKSGGLVHPEMDGLVVREEGDLYLRSPEGLVQGEGFFYCPGLVVF